MSFQAHRQSGSPQKLKVRTKKSRDISSSRPVPVVFFDWYETSFVHVTVSVLHPYVNIFLKYCRDDTFLPSTVLLTNGVTLQNPEIPDNIKEQLEPLQDQIITLLEYLKQNVKHFYIITNAEVCYQIYFYYIFFHFSGISSTILINRLPFSIFSYPSVSII